MTSTKKDNNQIPVYVVYIQSRTGDMLGYAFTSLKKAEKNVELLRSDLFSSGVSAGNAVILKTFLIQ